MKFNDIIVIVEKAMQLGYAVMGYINENNINEGFIEIKKNTNDNLSINFTLYRDQNSNDSEIYLYSNEHYGAETISVTESETLVYKLLIEKIKEYRKSQLIKDINNFFPKEEQSIKTADDLDDGEE